MTWVLKHSILFRVCLVMSDSLWPFGLYPTRLLCPWNFSGKITVDLCRFAPFVGLWGSGDPSWPLGSLSCPFVLKPWFLLFCLRSCFSSFWYWFLNFCYLVLYIFIFSGGSDGKASACNAGDPGSFSGSGRSSGEGNGNPLQNSCLENPMDGGAW